jgi:hypothetical protein
MKKVYTTANGKQINLDALIAQNENTIAVGNMKVNARGDQLGVGGKVEIPKEKLMKINTPIAIDNPPTPHQVKKPKDLTDEWIEPTAKQEQEIKETIETEEVPKLRGSLADAVSKTKLASAPVVKKTGPSRI